MSVRRLHPRDDTAEQLGNLPSSVQTERAIVAAALLAESRRAAGENTPDVIADVRGETLLEAFSHPALRSLWGLMLERRRQGLANDLVEVALAARTAEIRWDGSTLKAADLFEWARQLLELIEHSSGLPSLVRQFAAEIRECSLRRQRIVAAHGLLEALQRDHRPMADWYSAASAPLSTPGDQPPGDPRIGPALVAIMSSVDHLADVGSISVPGIKTGLTDLDQFLGGLHDSNLIIVAGRPGMGKTALALTITLNAARSGVPVGFVSLEMSARELTTRLISQASRVEVSRVYRGPLGPDDLTALARAAGELSSLPIQIAEPKSEWSAVADECRRMVCRGVRLLAIDYVGLMTVAEAKSTRMNRQEIVSVITRSAKEIAKSLRVPVLLLSQLNRDSVRDQEKRPQIWHLRDSGTIEQDADVVAMIHRRSAYDKAAPRDVAEIIVAKHRNGPEGSVDVRWLPRIARFEDIRPDLEFDPGCGEDRRYGS